MHRKIDPEAVRDFAYKLALLAVHHPFTVTSWLRTPKRNALVGGKAESRHLDGLGADCVLDKDEPAMPFMTHARQLGLVVLDEGDHIHVQEGGNRFRPTIT